jgi:hypothetical protein
MADTDIALGPVPLTIWTSMSKSVSHSLEDRRRNWVIIGVENASNTAHDVPSTGMDTIFCLALAIPVTGSVAW